jgi:polyhydroxyalkanoate synthesis regulator phasin
MTTDEARKFVDDLVQQAQQPNIQGSSSSENREPRSIEIISEDDDEPNQPPKENIDGLRQQVQALQDELKKLKNE